MIFAAFLLIVGIALAASAVKIVPPDSVALVERLGRPVRVISKPGLVWIRPYIERLIILPSKSFPVSYVVQTEDGGPSRAVQVEGQCLIQDPMKFHENVPPIRTHDASENASRFLGALLNTEGRALLRAMAEEGVEDSYEFSNRLAERLDWHTRSVGLKVRELRVVRFG